LQVTLADDNGVDDIGERIALLGEVSDVVPQGLAGLLPTTLEVPRVAGSDVRVLKVSDKNFLEICPVADGVGGQELKPGTDVLP
jgi:hypothetical protein